MSRGKRAQARPVFAALDLGTNNCRLLIARRLPQGGFRVIDSFARIVRLGEGLAAEGVLAPAAIERTLEALAFCARKMARWGVTHRRTVTTEACRRARNGTAFIERVKRETGIALEVIDPAEEVRLAVAGCAPLLDPRDRGALLFDIGGGSTELAWLVGRPAGGFGLEAWASIPYGVVNLAEAFDCGDGAAAAYAAMTAFMTQQIEQSGFMARLGATTSPEATHLLGTSGTVTTLASLHLGLERYERARIDGLWLTRREAAAAVERLRLMSFQDRKAHACIGPARADLVMAGAATLEAIGALWPSPRLRVADRGLREGMLMTLIEAGGDSGRHAARRRGRRRRGKTPVGAGS